LPGGVEVTFYLSIITFVSHEIILRRSPNYPFSMKLGKEFQKMQMRRNLRPEGIKRLRRSNKTSVKNLADIFEP